MCVIGVALPGPQRRFLGLRKTVATVVLIQADLAEIHLTCILGVSEAAVARVHPGIAEFQFQLRFRLLSHWRQRRRRCVVYVFWPEYRPGLSDLWCLRTDHTRIPGFKHSCFAL